MRGTLLPLWTPSGSLDEATAKTWRTLAYRIALGVELVGHLEPVVDDERLYVGFCGHSPEVAELLRDAVLQENVAAELAKAHPGMEQEHACDVLLPCSPAATEDEVNHAVLAAVKGAHAFFCAKPMRGA